MKTTIKQVIDSSNALNTLMASKQPVKTAWRISRILRLLEPELKAYEEARMNLINQYAEIDGDKFNVKAENVPAFNAGLESLLTEEIDLAVEPIGISSLEGSISAQDISVLEWVLIED